MPRPIYILVHAAAAAAFVFLLQTFGLKQSFETSALWAIGFGIAAAGLAWHQTNR